MQMNVKTRYTGIQTIFKALGAEGCFFLCLLSIAEETLGKEIDTINAIRQCLKNKLIRKNDFWVYDSAGVLELLTGLKWTKKEVKELPSLSNNDYSVCKYYNPKTKLTHFRRRGFDTWDLSITVRDGYIQSYYLFTWH